MPLKNEPVAVLLAWEQGFAPQASSKKLLFHKTTCREEYDQAWQLAETQGAFDMLFCNERGELTEGGRSNVFVKIKDRYWTPPVSSGLLPGVMRAVMRCNPLHIPTEYTPYFDQWRTKVVHFDPTSAEG